jgi:hypothetical protein
MDGLKTWVYYNFSKYHAKQVDILCAYAIHGMYLIENFPFRMDGENVSDTGYSFDNAITQLLIDTYRIPRLQDSSGCVDSYVSNIQTSMCEPNMTYGKNARIASHIFHFMNGSGLPWVSKLYQSRFQTFLSSRWCPTSTHPGYTIPRDTDETWYAILTITNDFLDALYNLPENTSLPERFITHPDIPLVPYCHPLKHDDESQDVAG